MTCPHCLVGFHYAYSKVSLPACSFSSWEAEHAVCPACGKAIIHLLELERSGQRIVKARSMVHPKTVARLPLSSEVPKEFAEDYREACLVLVDSPKASAALSRRCLQHILRTRPGIVARDLSGEIDQAMKSLPSHLSTAIDAVRVIGNFAAHPQKSTNSGEIFDVEPGEAEWSLEVLEGLFDFYFVQPAVLKAKKDAMNKKLQEAGKPPMR